MYLVFTPRWVKIHANQHIMCLSVCLSVSLSVCVCVCLCVCICVYEVCVAKSTTKRKSNILFFAWSARGQKALRAPIGPAAGCGSARGVGLTAQPR